MNLIASHRGAALQWPESSVTAFRGTATLGVEQVEFDIHPTADGEVVVIHDPTLDRTTDGSGPVAARTLEELRRLKLRGTDDDRIPTLAELAAIFVTTPIALRMEVKFDEHRRPYPGLLKRALAVLDTAGLRARTVVTSFLAEIAAEAAVTPGIARATWMVNPDVYDDVGLRGVIAVARDIGIRHLGISHTRLSAETLLTLRRQGFGVGAWGVNEEAAIRAMLQLGVDVLITGLPTRALELRREMRERAKAARAS